MPNYKNLFLKQSYLDSYDDYLRSLKGKTSTWDFCIITASNESQAEAYREQIKYRQKLNQLPKNTHYAVIPDKDGKRIGSGGATLAVMKYIKEVTKADSFRGIKALVIHSGGDSKRVPQYSACGKLFSPVPRELPSGRRSTLFDELIIAASGVPARITDGIFVCSGDVLLLFNPLQIDFYSEGAAALSIKEHVNTGCNHGVFLRDENGNVGKFLHKQPPEALKEQGAVNAQNKVDIDTGAIIFESHLLDDLYTLIDTDEKFERYVNDHVRLSFYADFLYPLASNSTLEEFYNETPEGEFSEELKLCRKEIWHTISKYRIKLICFSPASFIHFGTTKELLNLVGREIENYQFIGWERNVCSNLLGSNCSASNSFISSDAKIGDYSYIEDSYIYENVVIGEGSIVSGLTLKNVTVPDGVVMHGLKLNDGRFTVRTYLVNDNPKEKFWFSSPIDCALWDKKLFPVCNTIEEAVSATLSKRTDCELISLHESFEKADVKAILPWQTKLSDVVKVEKFIDGINKGEHFSKVNAIFETDGINERVKCMLNERLSTLPFSTKIRVYYYLSKITTGDEAQEFELNCFSEIREELLNANPLEHSSVSKRRIAKDHVISKLPIRVNFGGGWTDTPPYCNENGAAVLNAAVLLDNHFPIEVELKKLDEEKIVLTSADYGSYKEFFSIDELSDCSNPHDPYALQKATLIACGIIPRDKSASLSDILKNLGGGIYFSTQVINIPRGSGLGTSSILAAACVKGIYEFLGEPCSDNMACNRVLQIEQIMSTGGGWQDQMGGLVPGIKYLYSNPGNVQNVKCDTLNLSEETIKELGSRFCLIYTGQRRLARNLLREVMGRYIGNNPDSLAVLIAIKEMANTMKQQLENGDVDAFANSLTEHWELSKKLDQGCTNTCIDQIFLACDDMVAGKMICGAGGGGFLQVVLKKGVTKQDLQERLLSVFADSGVDVWECSLHF